MFRFFIILRKVNTLPSEFGDDSMIVVKRPLWSTQRHVFKKINKNNNRFSNRLNQLENIKQRYLIKKYQLFIITEKSTLNKNFIKNIFIIIIILTVRRLKSMLSLKSRLSADT